MPFADWTDLQVEAVEALALDLLQLTDLPLLGSNCHNLTTRPPDLKEGRKVIMQKLGETFLKKVDLNGEWVATPSAEVQ